MKISIITVTFNSVQTLFDTFRSIQAQDYPNIEYIIVDGQSTDGTLELIQMNSNIVTKYISEPDNGIYDAMNKGLRLATGDVIGFLHSDDEYANSQVISTIASNFGSTDIDALFADIVYVQGNERKEVIRKYRSNRFTPAKIEWGWMPAHPSLFLNKRVYAKYGVFKTDYKIAGDYEFVARIFHEDTLKYKYLPEVLVNMRMGGVSTGGISNSIVLNKEVLRACKENNINTNIFKILSKYPAKLFDSFSRA